MTEPGTDEYGRSDAHRDLWRQAKTLLEARELMARWLLGELQYQPLYGDPAIDEETANLVDALAVINRGGLLTEQSQPGLVDSPLAQREFVTGRCAEDTAALFQMIGTVTDIVVVTHQPGTASRSIIPVTVYDNEVQTHLGYCDPFDDADAHMWEEEANRSLADELAKCWYIEAFDPVWGRTGHLMKALTRALES